MKTQYPVINCGATAGKEAPIGFQSPLSEGIRKPEVLSLGFFAHPILVVKHYLGLAPYYTDQCSQLCRKTKLESTTNKELLNRTHSIEKEEVLLSSFDSLKLHKTLKNHDVQMTEPAIESEVTSTSKETPTERLRTDQSWYNVFRQSTSAGKTTTYCIAKGYRTRKESAPLVQHFRVKLLNPIIKEIGTQSFFTRFEYAIRSLSCWESWAMTFVLGCSLGVLPCMFVVLAIILVRGHRHGRQCLIEHCHHDAIHKSQRAVGYGHTLGQLPKIKIYLGTSLARHLGQSCNVTLMMKVGNPLKPPSKRMRCSEPLRSDAWNALVPLPRTSLALPVLNHLCNHSRSDKLTKDQFLALPWSECQEDPNLLEDWSTVCNFAHEQP